mmetsp:Transcript_20249/g.47859  ORF Transcript_20249/g.47859 Transcript_20249/m.47859 type:complete len:215 (-) Transcript_20249:554-1198(-)
MSELSTAEFRRQGIALAQTLTASPLGWSWVECADDRPGHLRARCTVAAVACQHCACAAGAGAGLEEDEDAGAMRAEADDVAARASATPTPLAHRLEYHIALHPTYGQPTLLIFGQHDDSSALRTAEVWAHLSGEFQAHRDSPFVLTEVEHPTLSFPCFAIHPCRTGDLLAVMRSTADGAQTFTYLASWWSVVAPLVNQLNRVAWYASRSGRDPG